MDRFDLQLIADYRKGDKKSLDALVERYLKPIYSFVYQYAGNSGDAEDITQEVFIKVWRNLHKFNPKKNLTLHHGESSGSEFKTWIFSIAKNACIDFLRKKKTIPFSEFDAENGNLLTDTLVDSAPSPQNLSETAETVQALVLAIDKLSPKYQEVLRLRYDSQFNFREIAESLGEPLHTVKSRCRRAIIKLKELLSVNK